MLWFLIAVAVPVAIGLAARALANPDPFRVAATSLGITYSRSVPDLLPRLSGTINRIPVRVDIPPDAAAEIRYRVFYPDLGIALRLERETTIDRTLGALGSGDREIGAKSFDDAFRVNTSRPDALAKMMTPELRERLVSLVERYPSAVIADGDITLTTKADEPTTAAIVNTVNDLVIVAVLLLANAPPPLETPPPRRVARASVPPPPAATPSPTKPTPASSQPAPTPRSEPEPEPPPQHEAAQSSGLPDGFFNDVFGENRLSFESDDRFEREIAGSVVNLSGMVKQSNRYQDEPDATPASGVKAIVTVAQIDNDLYGMTDIDAVVYLAGTDELDRGEHISFTGRLTGVDAFMRNLFIDDARLTG
jgi:hypothetical protein